jgi:hypothetical protein
MLIVLRQLAGDFRFTRLLYGKEKSMSRRTADNPRAFEPLYPIPLALSVPDCILGLEG